MDHKKSREKIAVLIRELVSFNIVGILNTALTYALYSGLVALGVHHLVALCLEYPVGITVSYHLNRRFTFRAGEGNLWTFLRMVAVYLPSLAFNFVLLFVFSDILALNPYVGQFLALGIVTALTFAMQKIFVFRKPRTDNGSNDRV